ncbi:metallophosphoesterase [Oceanobacillus halotolerans]|uniref:metallophosphoesterase n=1 Tax=Oceanobacillus halotolerans TaxID=2663380 RepID=UPI0013D968E4|nr:metallophosphoesterase [Oceanobacillus halotolerans]
MTRVLIMSDSHGLTEEVKTIKERHGLKHMIHCGDSELDMDRDELEGFVKVGGNCDIDARFPTEQKVTIDGITFFVVHGHLHNVKSSLMSLSYRAEEEGAKIVCFGHTHVAGAEKLGNQLLLNPGSIRLPRTRQEKTYIILEWESLENVKVTFYTLSGDIVDALTYTTTLR